MSAFKKIVSLILYYISKSKPKSKLLHFYISSYIESLQQLKKYSPKIIGTATFNKHS